MKVVKRDEKDTFDIIMYKIGVLEKEREYLITNMLAMGSLLDEYKEVFKYAPHYIDSVNKFTKESLEENNKETNLYEKMLRYLQLMITNDTYDYYTDSFYYDYFNKVIEILDVNKYHRNARMAVFNYSLKLGISKSAASVSITCTNGLDEPVLSDDLYNEILKIIPRK